MLFWIILLIFALPLISYLIQLWSDKVSTNNKLEKIQRRLKEIEERKEKKDNAENE